MRRVLLSLVSALVLGAALFGLIDITRGQGPGTTSTLSQDVQDAKRREILSPQSVDAPAQPNIGFIDSPSATCYQPDRARDECYLTWYYLSVGAAPDYMITMTLALNDSGPVAHSQGFFQTSMYIPYNMLGDGFKVPCGAPGAGGNPLLGNAYPWTVRARDSQGLTSANYGTAYCPAYVP